MDTDVPSPDLCNSNTLVPYGPKMAPSSSQWPLSQVAFDYHRAQFYDYTARLAVYGLRPGYYPPSLYHPQTEFPHALFLNKLNQTRFIHEEPKPSQSYIGLIAMAILESKDKKLILSDIYQWILDNYSYFRNRGPGWRNSIRHNLSLNDCFIKAGRSANGKGHYWAVHPANVDDFTKGDFRRRRAQRKVRKHMGLSVPDEDDSPPLSPNPQCHHDQTWLQRVAQPPSMIDQARDGPPGLLAVAPPLLPVKKRFDMASILAPDGPKHEYIGPQPTAELAASAPNSPPPTDKLAEPLVEIVDSDDGPVNLAKSETKSDLTGAEAGARTPSPAQRSPSPGQSPRSPPRSPRSPWAGQSQPWSAEPKPAWQAGTSSGWPGHSDTILTYPGLTMQQAAAAQAAQHWRETFSKILAQTYDTAS